MRLAVAACVEVPIAICAEMQAMTRPMAIYLDQSSADNVSIATAASVLARMQAWLSDLDVAEAAGP
jgi:hypothetical protein